MQAMLCHHCEQLGVPISALTNSIILRRFITQVALVVFVTASVVDSTMFRAIKK